MELGSSSTRPRSWRWPSSILGARSSRLRRRPAPGRVVRHRSPRAGRLARHGGSCPASAGRPRTSAATRGRRCGARTGVSRPPRDRGSAAHRRRGSRSGRRRTAAARGAGRLGRQPLGARARADPGKPRQRAAPRGAARRVPSAAAGDARAGRRHACWAAGGAGPDRVQRRRLSTAAHGAARRRLAHADGAAVADLAAEGPTNPEIAQALFVTVKTIETHLGRVYRKLGIGARNDLPAALAGYPADGNGSQP
jgi:DNA-binding CsgD family transcriptional regulator